uniref:WRKY19-like zinc finger domain-containing protein n=1 Tax=Aplanochytrium stocchinoi TaxID=215587 RepID=A0A7S3LPV4_9STRA|mmetsp:Transcript_12913/g.16763  ORF Transcript_12913/g.16763 Transcript_12913/m.16763 type:complete len:318 (+) Transcript_12913:332-1285(+)
MLSNEQLQRASSGLSSSHQNGYVSFVVPQGGITISPQLLPASYPMVNNGLVNNLLLQSLAKQLQGNSGQPQLTALQQLGLISSQLPKQPIVKQDQINTGFQNVNVRLSKSPQFSTSMLLGQNTQAQALFKNPIVISKPTLQNQKKKAKTSKLDRYRKRCLIQDCNKLSQGNTKFCFAHGGGYRCQAKECPKPARGRTGFCIAHGGGKRCKHETCSKSAQGRTEFCKKHGGGKRCQFPACKTSARGSTNFCTAHGGGRRCKFYTCTKSARDNSSFCVAHGGGKRCVNPNCTKSAIGSTKFCTRHGTDTTNKEKGAMSS